MVPIYGVPISRLRTVKYRIPARQGALHPEILHVTQTPCDIMSVDLLGAIIRKDTSICSLVQEIARRIDHFTREPVYLRLFSVWHSRVHYSATRTSFATIYERALFTGFHMLYHLCRYS